MTLRIAFIGNCQVSGLRAAACALRPDAEVLAFHLSHAASPDVVLDQLETCEAIVTNVRHAAKLGKLFSRRALSRPGRKAIYLPAFLYSGLHPDTAFFNDPKGLVASALWNYHSAIAVASFLLGLPARRAERLYNAHVFRRLGYLDAPDLSRAAVLKLFADSGYDLAPAMDRWTGGEPFMHVANHPAISVLSALATLALARLRLVAEGTPPPQDVEDSLARAYSLPVYAAIARRAGVQPREGFLRAATEATDDGDRALSLSSYVEGSYAIYRDLDPAILRTHQVVAVETKLQAVLAEAHYPVPSRTFA